MDSKQLYVGGSWAWMTKENFSAYVCGLSGMLDRNIDAWRVVSSVGVLMDGKVLNKRFTDAVNVKLSSPSVSVSFVDRYGDKILSIWDNNRCIVKSGIAQYFDKDNYYKEIKVSKFLVNGRISAALLNECCEYNINKTEETKELFIDACENWDKYTTARENVLREIKKGFAGVNSLFVPYELHKYDWDLIK